MKNKSKNRNSNFIRNSEFGIQKFILYLDTSEPEAIIAIYLGQGPTLSKQGWTLVEEEEWLAARELSATLSDKYLWIIKKAKIKQEDLSGICVFVGPGSFTGLRIGISFANGLAYALQIPIFETRKKGFVDLVSPKKIALPYYDSEPKITKPKKKYQLQKSKISDIIQSETKNKS